MVILSLQLFCDVTMKSIQCWPCEERRGAKCHFGSMTKFHRIILFRASDHLVGFCTFLHMSEKRRHNLEWCPVQSIDRCWNLSIPKLLNAVTVLKFKYCQFVFLCCNKAQEPHNNSRRVRYFSLQQWNTTHFKQTAGWCSAALIKIEPHICSSVEEIVNL